MNYTAFRKVPVDARAQPQSRQRPFPAPTGGWVSAKNPAGGTPLKLYGPPAERLDCFFPTETGIEIMGGSRKFATVSTMPLESAWAYIGGTVKKMFAGSDGKIFNVTSPVDANTPPAPDVTGQTTNYYSTVNFATAGGNFLYALNDSNKPQLYNGTTWQAIDGASTPAITGVTTSGLSQVNVYRNRLFMVQGGTVNVWALPVDSLGGAAIQISLAGVFQKGGAVLYTATWSLDSGSGLDDNLVVMSTEGEIAVYQGSDPSDPDNWGIIGVYDGPKPLGKNSSTKAGGDLLLVTEQGMIPISDAVSKDKAALSLYAISRNIEPDWIADARQRKNLPWEIVKWPTRQRALISTPVTSELSVTPAQCYGVNTTTGAWCRRPGWNTRCLVLHDDVVYFGTNSGTLIQMEITGSDDGTIYSPTAVFAWDSFGAQGFQKTVTSMRAIFITVSAVEPVLSVSTDYTINLMPTPNASPDAGGGSEWDVGTWDNALWDVGVAPQPYQTHWVSVNLSGYAHAPQIQISFGGESTPRGELILMDTLYELGEVMI